MKTASTPTAIATGAGIGAVVGGAHAADEGQQVDTINAIKRDRKNRQSQRREFADARPRDGMGQFTPAAQAALTPGTMAAAYGNVQAEKVARRRNLLARLGLLRGVGRDAAGLAASGAGGLRPPTFAPAKIAAQSARLLSVPAKSAARLSFARRAIHELNF
ncbi:MAG TPA: hypothetical protein VIM61_01380 [Chthoniobacterales bacterium]